MCSGGVLIVRGFIYIYLYEHFTDVDITKIRTRFNYTDLGPESKTHYLGDKSAGATPLPIPNRAVKPRCADGTARATLWESR